MGLLDGIGRGKKWKAGTIRVQRLDLLVKGGADSAEEAAEAFASLFREPGKFSFERVEVAKATVRWGYTPSTRGALEGTRLTVERLDGEEGWGIRARGGTFRQNWIKGLEIKEMLVEVKPAGVFIRKADLRGLGGGQAGVHFGGGEGRRAPGFGGAGEGDGAGLEELRPAGGIPEDADGEVFRGVPCHGIDEQPEGGGNGVDGGLA